MYDSAILHGGGNFARDPPLALQFELQRASLVGLDRAGAQFRRQVGSRRQGEPFACSRHGSRTCCLSKHIGLKAAGLAGYQPASQQARVFQKIAQEAGRAGVFA